MITTESFLGRSCLVLMEIEVIGIGPWGHGVGMLYEIRVSSDISLMYRCDEHIT